MKEQTNEPNLKQPERPVTDEAKRKRKAVYAFFVLLIPFLFSLYLIFGGGGANEEIKSGFNAVMPDGKPQNIEGNKRRAAEKAQADESQNQRVQTLGDNPFSLLGPSEKKSEAKSDLQENVTRSQDAYKDVTEHINSFYNEPKTDPKVESLQRQIADLQKQLEAKQDTEKVDPLAMVERSYALASKYLAPTPQQPSAAPEQPSGTKALTVRKVGNDPVSSLAPPLSDSMM